MKIHVRSVYKTYPAAREGGANTIHALNGCSLTVQPDRFTVIAGRSGCGKTTLLKTIAGLEEADSGVVEFTAGTRPRTGFMFQDHRLLPWLTVEQNLALAFPRPRNKAEQTAIHADIARALDMTGIKDRAAALPRELSGGMAQRAALARCLCRKPSLLLLDEPLSSLDAFTKLRLRGELENLKEELKLTVILVTHDIEDAVYFGDTICVMNRGTILHSMTVPLPRPRDCRTETFQRYCRELEDAVCDACHGEQP